MASKVMMEAYTFRDPSGRLPNDEVMLSASKHGIEASHPSHRTVIECWEWSRVEAVTGEPSRNADEMDLVTIIVAAAGVGINEGVDIESGVAPPFTFQFECESHSALVRALQRTPSDRLPMLVSQSSPAGQSAKSGAKGGTVARMPLLPPPPARAAAVVVAAPRKRTSLEPERKAAPTRTKTMMVQDWDFVMMFPVRQCHSQIVAKTRFSCDRFCKIMLGVRTATLIRGGAAGKFAKEAADLARKKVAEAAAAAAEQAGLPPPMAEDAPQRTREVMEFIDPAHRILRSNRCFLTPDGKHPHKLRKSGLTLEDFDKKIESETNSKKEDALRQELMDGMKEYMEQEYIAEVGNNKPCTAEQFAMLVAKSAVRRLLLTCGLYTQMKWSADKDEVLVCIRADEGDLRNAADKSNYRMQTLNQPFDKGRKHFLPEVVFKDPNLMTRAIAMMQERVDDDETPMMDPGMYRHHWQDAMLEKIMAQTGHREEHGYAESKPYVAPYADYTDDEGNEHFQIIFRHYRNRKGELTPFRQVDRIRLTMEIMNRHLNIPRLKHSKLLTDCFPLHDKTVLEHLRNGWALNWRMHPLPTGTAQPLLLIRDYFGEKVALYFAWLEHYTSSLIFPAVYGLAMQWSPSEGISLIVFGCVVSIWASRVTEQWNQQNAVLNLMWGTANFEAQEAERPQFKGVPRFSPIDDQPEIHHAAGTARARKQLVAMGTCTMLMCCAVSATWGCLLMKRVMSNPHNMGETGIKLAGFLNAMQIGIGNYLYGRIAMRLTDWENHRTQSEWETMLITKTFLFRFLNSYVSFFYIAFAKFLLEVNDLKRCEILSPNPPGFKGNLVYPGMPECYKGCGTVFRPMRCMDELSTQIMMIFVTQLVAGNFSEIVFPFISRKLKVRKEMKGLGKITDPKTGEERYRTPEEVYEQPELEAKFSEYRIEKEAFNDYAEMVIQFGFVTLFVVAFPLTPVLALVNNILELHVDSFKLCFGFRRPFPQIGSNIGKWAFFMNLQSTISVVTNIAIIIFTTTLFNSWRLYQKWLLFIVAEHVLLVIKVAIQGGTKAEPEWCKELHARHTRIVQRVFKGLIPEVEDDDDEEAEALVLTVLPNNHSFAEKVTIDLDELEERFKALQNEDVSLGSLAGDLANKVVGEGQDAYKKTKQKLRYGQHMAAGVGAGLVMGAGQGLATVKSIGRSIKNGELDDDLKAKFAGAMNTVTEEFGEMTRMLV
jgi:hypothetical protein